MLSSIITDPFFVDGGQRKDPMELTEHRDLHLITFSDRALLSNPTTSPPLTANASPVSVGI
jgi:hypothetical protein